MHCPLVASAVRWNAPWSPVSKRDNPDQKMQNDPWSSNFNTFWFKLRGERGWCERFCLSVTVSRGCPTPGLREQSELACRKRVITLHCGKGGERAPECERPSNKWRSPLWRGSGCSCRWYRKGPTHSTICCRALGYIFLELVPALFQQMRTLLLLRGNSTWSPSTRYLNLFQ